jgi:ABC-type sugar transport system ATPase subunit
MSYSEIYQEVFNFFDEEHGLVLTQSQMEEIINRCAQWIVMIDAIENDDLIFIESDTPPGKIDPPIEF